MTKSSLVAALKHRNPSRMLTVLTTARLVLVPVLIATFMVHPGVTTVFLVLFMAADLYDGVLARQLSADGPQRRAMDSIVDRIAIDSCLVAAFIYGALPAILLFGFLARDFYCAVLCARMMRQRRVAIKADVVYRGLNFSIAVWALSAPFVSAGARTAFAAVVFVASIAVAFDLTRSVRIVLNARPELSHQVIDADLLRKGAADLGTGRCTQSSRSQVHTIAPTAAPA